MKVITSNCYSLLGLIWAMDVHLSVCVCVFVYMQGRYSLYTPAGPSILCSRDVYFGSH